MSKFSLRSIVAGLLVGSAAAASAATPSPSSDGFYRYPTVAAGAVVFAAEGDLWKVPVEGGVATRLTAYEGEEKFPALSPDGRYIAFTAQYDGTDDVYVMAASGGGRRRAPCEGATAVPCRR